jgi:ornithine cyclodeaminase/alanine dehydrogenase-like protein (mu-crystallin family)
VDAMVDAFGIGEIRVVSRQRERAEAFCERMAERYPRVAFTPSGPDGATTDGCDIVVAATRSSTPVLPEEAARPGTLVCGIGSHRPDAAEIPPAVVRSAARVVVDTRAGSIDSAGDIAPLIAAGHLTREDVTELGDLVAGRRGGRATDEEVTVFKSAGFAALDLVAGAVLVQEARRRGLGRHVEF